MTLKHFSLVSALIAGSIISTQAFSACTVWEDENSIIDQFIFEKETETVIESTTLNLLTPVSKEIETASRKENSTKRADFWNPNDDEIFVKSLIA